jgi:NADH-quinone oxidoreductase subunit D
MVRFEEIRQSVRIMEQSLDLLKKIKPRLARRRCERQRPAHRAAAEGQEVYSTIEGTINHFKLIMEGVDVPAGEVYGYTEAGNGELGFLLVSRGGGNPWRVRVRGPCFFSLQAAKPMIKSATCSPTSSPPSARST